MIRYAKKLLAIVIILSMSILPSFATENGADNLTEGKIVGNTVKILDKSESISVLMENKDLSYEQAAQEYSAMVARSERVEERYITYSAGMGYQIEIGCLVVVACGSGHCKFVEVLDDVWSEASGSGSYTWDAFYTYVTIEGSVGDSLRFRTRGVLVVETDITFGFEAAGFEILPSVGGTYYARKTMTIDEVKVMGG